LCDFLFGALPGHCGALDGVLETFAVGVISDGTGDGREIQLLANSYSEVSQEYGFCRRSRLLGDGRSLSSSAEAVFLEKPSSPDTTAYTRRRRLLPSSPSSSFLRIRQKTEEGSSSPPLFFLVPGDGKINQVECACHFALGPNLTRILLSLEFG
jgi:hypothetical protein